jgi:polar amino acid transport system permease protein
MNYTFRFRDVFAAWDYLMEGVVMTLGLSAVTMVLGLLIGVACAAGRLYGPGPLRAAIATYVEVIRNTPLLIQLFIVFFGLPGLGLRLDATTAAVISLTINLGAYATEIVRAGLQAVPRTQVEAGHALGLSGAFPGPQADVPGACQPVHPADAGNQHCIADLGAGPVPHRFDHTVADLP